MRSALLVEQGESDKALVDLDEAVRLRPDDVKVREMRLLMLLFKKIRPEQAVEDLVEIVRTDKTAKRYAILAQLRKDLGRLEQALGDADEAVRIEPQAMTYFLRGSIRQELGQNERALSDFDEEAVRRCDPAWPLPLLRHPLRELAALVAGRPGQGGNRPG